MDPCQLGIKLHLLFMTVKINLNYIDIQCIVLVVLEKCGIQAGNKKT